MKKSALLLLFLAAPAPAAPAPSLSPAVAEAYRLMKLDGPMTFDEWVFLDTHRDVAKALRMIAAENGLHEDASLPPMTDRELLWWARNLKWKRAADEYRRSVGLTVDEPPKVNQ